MRKIYLSLIVDSSESIICQRAGMVIAVIREGYVTTFSVAKSVFVHVVTSFTEKYDAALPKYRITRY